MKKILQTKHMKFGLATNSKQLITQNNIFMI